MTAPLEVMVPTAETVLYAAVLVFLLLPFACFVGEEILNRRYAARWDRESQAAGFVCPSCDGEGKHRCEPVYDRLTGCWDVDEVTCWYCTGTGLVDRETWLWLVEEPVPYGLADSERPDPWGAR